MATGSARLTTVWLYGGEQSKRRDDNSGINAIELRTEKGLGRRRELWYTFGERAAKEYGLKNRYLQRRDEH